MTCPADRPRWPIWVISLHDATARREAVNEQLNRLQLQHTFIDAVDGRRGLAPEFERDVNRPGTVARNGYRMSDAEYGCALSHQHAYKKLIELGLPGAIILEDDIILTQRFRNFYADRSYEAAPLIQLFFYDAVVWRGRGIVVPCTRLERLVASAWSTVGYSISCEAAAIMRHQSLPLQSRADWPCDTANLIGHYVAVPRVVLHPPPDETQSTIGATRDNVLLAGFDFNAGYAQGWRRFFSFASWRRLALRPFKRRIYAGFEPTAEEIKNGF